MALLSSPDLTHRLLIPLTLGGLLVAAATGCVIAEDDDGPNPCTGDAIMCTDGTFAGRVGPECSFDCSAHGGIAQVRFFDEQRTYVYEPDNCSGTPENPNCVDSITFHPAGVAEKLFDDIIAQGTYEILGNNVSLSVPSFDYSAELTLANNDTELILGDAVYVLVE